MDDKEIKNKILEEYDKGNVVCYTVEDFEVMNLDKFLTQPVDGILYDLNRGEEVVLAYIDNPKWVNDYAVAKVIRKLHQKVKELEATQIKITAKLLMLRPIEGGNLDEELRKLAIQIKEGRLIDG